MAQPIFHTGHVESAHKLQEGYQLRSAEDRSGIMSWGDTREKQQQIVTEGSSGRGACEWRRNTQNQQFSGLSVAEVEIRERQKSRTKASSNRIEMRSKQHRCNKGVPTELEKGFFGTFKTYLYLYSFLNSALVPKAQVPEHSCPPLFQLLLPFQG